MSAEQSVAYLFQRHAVLNKQRYPRVEVSYVLLQHEVLLRLTRYLDLILMLRLLCYVAVSGNANGANRKISPPLARSSAISKSFSFVADMDRYSACEYRFDCRAERPSLWEEMVFCREMGS